MDNLRGFAFCVKPAQASVHHPNVASVFHLDTTGQNYFYRMEFVGGETLQSSLNAQADWR
jgi:hypothetical protein